jgi:peptide/nickel transport system permease protein
MGGILRLITGGVDVHMNLFRLKKRSYDSLGSLSAIAWKRFKKDKLAVGSLCFIALITTLAIFGYFVIPNPSPFANAQYLEIAASPPGFSVQMLKIRKNEEIIDNGFISKLLYGEKSNYLFVPIYSYKFKDTYLEIEKYTGSTPNDGEKVKFYLPDILYSLSGKDTRISNENGILSFYDISGRRQQESIEKLKNTVLDENIIRKHFWLGTDRFGRNMISQLVIGARVSLSVGLISVIISLLLGIFIGAVSGFFRGWVDDFIVWFINVVWSIPTILLVIAITFALGKGFWQVFIAVGLTMWVEVARVVRGQIMSVRENEFVEAARALGYKNFRIIFRHILPNVISSVIVISAANFASAILIEAGLSFLGIGVQPPMPSWGTMIKEHYAYIILDSPYLALLPGIAIMLMVLAFMLVGNGLRDALDEKSVEVKG